MTEPDGDLHAPFENDDDVDGLDLTPRTAPPVGGAPTDRGRRVAVIGVLAVLAIALIFMAYQGLSNATVFFRNADEAVAQKDSLGTQRFRLQGSVVAGSIESEGNTVTFVVTHDDVDVDVVHLGDPPELFQPDIPVVLEGHWSEDGSHFESDRILVKHSETYEEDNPDRVDEYVGDGDDSAGARATVNAALGSAGVALGLIACVAGVVTIAVGLRGGRVALIRTGRTYAFMALGGAIVSVIAMERALITRDFSVQFVAENGSSRTPALFNIASMWSALEGSILLWALVLAGYTALIAHKFRRRLDDRLVGWALLTMLVVGAFFFALMMGPANPFRTVTVPAGFDGPGPNPLLQEHLLMAFHPPMLYLGYVGFTVPFAFAIAALVTGRVGEGWLLVTRRWTLFAWGFLTVGIALGAWWSYEVLGWGGYWAWDAVENASLLPWLTGTAYIHSVMVQERRGMLRVWNLSLLCATFALTILGTFLTRSGVVDSVHAFSESDIGVWLLSFFGLVVVVTVGLIGWRGDRLRAPGRIDSPLSREGSFLANNIVFALFAFVVLLGTVFPLVVEALTDDQLSVGVTYFDRMTMPIGFLLLFLMAVAPVLPWRKASEELLRVRLFWPAVAGVLVVVVAVVLGARGVPPVLAFGLGAFAGGAALRQIVLATRRQGWRGLVGRTNGGMIVHLGVVLIAVALAASQSYSSEVELRLEPGETATFAGHTLEYQGIETVEESNKTVTAALVQIDGGKVYRPAINQYRFGTSTIGTPSVKWGFVEDVYLTLLSAPDGPGDPAVIRVILQPMVTWLWIGAGVMGFGTALAAFPGQRRRPVDPVSAPVPEHATDPEPDAVDDTKVGV